MIINNPHERQARNEEKRVATLRFLREEIWTTPDVLGELVQVSDRSSITRLVRGMEKDHLLVVDRVEIGSTQRMVIGITPHGQALACLEGEELNDRRYEIGRLPRSQFQHTLDVQRLRIRCERMGWKRWQNADHISPVARQSRDYVRPDAVAVHPRLGRLYIEIERHIKSRRRITATLQSHLTEIDQEHVYGVVWACPTPQIARALSSIIGGIESIEVLGRIRKLDQQDRDLLHITDYEHAPGLRLGEDEFGACAHG